MKSHPSKTQPPNTRQAARRIFRNARVLISGKAVGGVLSLAYIAIAARGLGPTKMGYLVLAHAYVLVIVGIARFQSWQAIIRFGAQLLGRDNQMDFRTLVRFSTKIDLFSAVLTVVAAAGLAGPVGRVMHWPTDAMPFIYAYCFAAPFLMAATPTGVLRLFDKYKTLGWQITLMPATRFLGAIILWAAGAGLNGFLVVWIASAVLDGASLWVLGWRELRRSNLTPTLFPAPAEKAADDWLPFMIKTNLADTVDVIQNRMPVLIVGAVLGSAASGFLQLAANLSNLIAHPANMLNQATYPELSKIAAARGSAEMRAVAFQSARTGVVFAAPIVLLYILLRNRLAVIVGGPEFVGAAILIALMAVAQIWRIASVVLQSAVVAIGKAGFVLGAQTASAALNIAVMAILLPRIGAAGAPTAIIAAWLVQIALFFIVLKAQPAGQIGQAPARPTDAAK